MKSFLLFLSLLFALNVFAQKDDCEKHFVKQKNINKKSTVFKDTLIQTKYCYFYSHVQRMVGFSFLKNGNKLLLNFTSNFSGSGEITKNIILGQNIKIAFIFEDGTNEIISFSNNEQNSKDESYTGGVSGGLSVTYNNIELTDILLKKFMSKKITKFEIQNPFGSPNEKKIIQEDINNKVSEYIIEMANCFYNKIKP